MRSDDLHYRYPGGERESLDEDRVARGFEQSYSLICRHNGAETIFHAVRNMGAAHVAPPPEPVSTLAIRIGALLVPNRS